MFIFCFIVLSLCTSAWLWRRLKSRSPSCRNPPPGPQAIPLFGHLHLLMQGPPHHVFMELSKRHGPIFSMRFGTVPIVVASSSQSAREFLRTKDSAFASRPASLVGRVLSYNRSDIGFAPYGDRWRILRRLVTLKLLTAKKLETFRQQRADEVRFMLESISTSIASGRHVIDVRQMIKQFAFNVMTRLLMSKRYFGQGVEDAKEAEEFVQVVDKAFELSGIFSIGEYLPYLRWLDLNRTEARLTAAASALDAFMQKIVSDRERGDNKVEQVHMNFLDEMLKLRDKGEQVLQGNTIKALMITLIMAGTDTSATTIEWALAELIKQPLILSKAQDEIARVVGTNQVVKEGHLLQMPYLGSIIKETFRLHPAIPLLLPHEAMEDCKVMGYDIAAGTRIIINAYAIQRDSSVWIDPLEFKPERFLDSQVDVRGHDFKLIPFGSGRRMCAGLSLALITVQLALANLLHAFNWEIPPAETVDTTEEKYGLTVPLAKNLELLAHPRFSMNVLEKVAHSG